MGKRYVVTGRVHPERAGISFDRVAMTFEDGGSAVASCESSQITVALEHKKLGDWQQATIAAEQVAAVVVGALGFSLGCGYSVELVQATDEDGSPHLNGVHLENPKGGSGLGFKAQKDVFDRAFHLAGHDSSFRFAVKDYLTAIVDDKDCATYCYRAIDSIRSAFAAKGGDGWKEMHAALGTKQEAIKSVVKDFADPVRRGKWTDTRPTDKDIRWKMLVLTRDVLMKYLDREIRSSANIQS